MVSAIQNKAGIMPKVGTNVKTVSELKIQAEQSIEIAQDVESQQGLTDVYLKERSENTDPEVLLQKTAAPKSSLQHLELRYPELSEKNINAEDSQLSNQAASLTREVVSVPSILGKASEIGGETLKSVESIGNTLDKLGSFVETGAQVFAENSTDGSKFSEVAKFTADKAQKMSAFGKAASSIAGKGIGALSAINTLSSDTATEEQKVHAATVMGKITAPLLESASKVLAKNAAKAGVRTGAKLTGKALAKSIPFLSIAADSTATWIAAKKAIRVFKDEKSSTAEKVWASIHVATQAAGFVPGIGDMIAFGGDLGDAFFFGGRDKKVILKDVVPV